MRILFIGDIVAKPGREIIKEVLPEIIKSENIDFVIANAENIAHGRGASVATLNEMMVCGVNYFTSGDHIFRQKDFEDEIDNLPIVRPANFPEGAPGKGYAIIDAGKYGNILLINLMGRTFLSERLDDPFRMADKILDETKDKNIQLTLVDFHAEATSEKHALAFYLDGRVTAVLGTHTHVPTCDNRVLPKGTFYVSDIGMTGIIDSVLGVKTEIIIDSYLTGLNKKFEWEDAGTKAFRSVVLDTQQETVERFDKVFKK